jgi:7-carboxy-7-deazaguanine synthase
MQNLCDLGYEVMIETGGSLSIKEIDPRVKIIMDLKCPSSGMEKKNLYENLQYLKRTDELKFVIGNREDYDWTVDVLKKYNMQDKYIILFSVVFGKLEPVELINWILEDKLDVRFQLQMHKYIWHPETKGV